MIVRIALTVVSGKTQNGTQIPCSFTYKHKQVYRCLWQQCWYDMSPLPCKHGLPPSTAWCVLKSKVHFKSANLSKRCHSISTWAWRLSFGGCALSNALIVLWKWEGQKSSAACSALLHAFRLRKSVREHFARSWLDVQQHPLADMLRNQSPLGLATHSSTSRLIDSRCEVWWLSNVWLESNQKLLRYSNPAFVIKMTPASMRNIHVLIWSDAQQRRSSFVLKRVQKMCC